MDNPKIKLLSNRNIIKLVLITILSIVGVVLFRQYGALISLDQLAARESELIKLQQDYPITMLLLAFMIYVTVTGLSLPGAAVLTLVCGWFWGFWKGILLVSFASTSGATLAFLMSRFILRETLQEKFRDRLSAINSSLESEGVFYLFMLRLIPAMPFFVINVVMGLTRMRTWTFWWVSQLGMLPGTMAYVYAGASVPHLSTLAEKGVSGIISPKLIIAFAILGIMPLALKWIIKVFRGRTQIENKK